MWLIRGPFEGTLDGAPLGTKLLKPSTEYPCGRRQPKDGPDSKKIMLVGKGTSRQSGTFAVGAFPDNLNSDAVLSLKLPEKDKPRIIRDGTDVEPDSNDSILLHGGDIFRKAITISIIHETLYVYLPPSSSIDRDAAKGFASRGKAFGFRVSRLWSDIASHYILDSVPTAKGPEPFEYPIEILCGLLSGSNFVTTAWLEALLAKAELPIGSGNLEERYDPPRPEDFCPTGPGANLWQPSESRQGLLKDVKFIILYDGAEPKKNFDKLVEVAGATAVTYSISSDKAADTPEKWAQYIRKARSKRGTDEQKASTIVLIGLQAEVLQTHDDWDRVYVEGAQHMDMRVIFEHDLALAILHADLEYINCSLEHDLPQQASQKVREPSPSPARFPSAQVVRSTLEEETLNTTQKVLAASKKRTFDAVESSDDIVKEEPETYPRQRPRKRVQLPTSRNALFGLDDSMVDDDDNSVTPAVAPSQSAPPESARHASLSQSQSYPTARSSRRTTQSYRPNMSSILGLDTLDEEPVPVPVAQRFKAEFESKLIGGTLSNALDEADAEEMAMDPDADVDLPEGDGTASQSLRSRGFGSQSAFINSGRTVTKQSSLRRTPGTKRKEILSDLEEDDEGTPTVSASQATHETQGKRVRLNVDRSSVPPTREPLITDQANVPGASTASTSTAKKEKVHEVPHEKRGAGANGVDTVPEFLQALASKKKGKKKEDDFDREFNKLRISKVPETANPIEEQARARADDMEVWLELGGRDAHPVGNFMVVVETDDVYRKDGGRKQAAPVADNGKPNFKRFRKKAPLHRAPPVELYLDPTVAYGEGPEYWHDDSTNDVQLNSQSQNRAQGRGAMKRAPSDLRSPSPPLRGVSKTASPTRRKAAAPTVVIDDNSDEDDGILFGGTQRGKSRARAGTAKPRPRMKQKEEEPEEYYPQEPPVQVLRSDDELEDEDEPPPRRAGTRVTSQVASRAKGKGKAAPATTSSRRGGRALAAIDEDESLEDFGAAMAAAVPSGDTQDDSMDVDANDSTIDPSAPATSTNMNTNSRATRSSGRSTAPSARGLRATSVAASASGMSTRRSRSVSVDPQSSQVQSSSAGGGTSANTGTTTAARKRPRKIEQDSDDEVAFKGLGKRAKK